MKDHSIRTAIWLRKQNIGFNDIIALISEYEVIDHYIPVLASIYVGAVLHPWSVGNLGKIIITLYNGMVKKISKNVHYCSFFCLLNSIKMIHIKLLELICKMSSLPKSIFHSRVPPQNR